MERLDFEWKVPWLGGGDWVVPALFSSRNMQYFRAMVNLQELKIENLDIDKFRTGFGECFGHFAPTLRSVTLSSPSGASRRQLLDFLRLFPKLDDINISSYHGGWVHEALDNRVVPISGGLRGRLTLNTFYAEGLLKDIIIAFGGMRFTSVDLRQIKWMRLLLAACADTLEVLRLHPEDIRDCKRVFDSREDSLSLANLTFQARRYAQDSNLSSCTALRSLEVPLYLLALTGETLSTITSSVFSEIVVIVSESGVGKSSGSFDSILRGLHKIREFGVVFCLEAFETSTSKAQSQRKLTLETKGAVAAGLYDFLPRPPCVFSRWVRNDGLHYANWRSLYVR